VQLEVLIESESGERRVQVVDGTRPLWVGRGPACSVHVVDDHVSRQHALITPSRAGLHIEDTSSNGTVAGGTLLHRRAADVPFGTPITVGTFTLYLRPGTNGANGSQPPTLMTLQSASQPPANGFSQSRPGFEPAPSTPRVFRDKTPLPVARGNGAPQPQAFAPALPPAIGHALAPAAAHALPPAVAHVIPPLVANVLPPSIAQAPPSNGASAAWQPVEADPELRREIHRRLLEHLDLATTDAARLDDPSFRPRVLTALRRIVKGLDPKLPPALDRDGLIGEMADEALGLGPLERLLADPTVSEIMVIDANSIYIEKNGKIVRSGARFTDDDRVRAVIERIVTPLGRRIDESSPLVDARLADGSRVNAIIRPLALKGSCITIRKFAKVPLTIDKLYGFDALTPAMGRFLTRSVVARKNIVISGGTGSGKTTLLNVLSAAIPPDERIVTIEDSAELQLKQPHVVSLETRPANMEGKGQYTIRDLVKNALRMRPDRIVVGECRGGEALDMLQAMNTGHDGSLTTTHANSPQEALSRLETLCLMAGVDLPARAIREQIATSVHLIVQQARLSDGSRRVTAVTEITGLDRNQEFELRTIYEYLRTGTGAGGKVAGQFVATGNLPSFLDQFIVQGLIKPGEPYL
jgi:pilus assembly protein CpaF